MMSIDVQVDKSLELILRFEVIDADGRVVEDSES